MTSSTPRQKRVVFLTQEEPFFVPLLAETIVQGLGERIVAVGLFNPAASWKQFRREYLNRLKYYGTTDFVRISVLYVKKKLSQRPLEKGLRDRNVPVMQMPSASLRDPRLIDSLRAIDPDILLVLGNQIVPAEILALPRDGCFNIHLSLLPRHRGREPVFNAMLARDQFVGVTVHEMTRDLDAGDIYAQEAIPLTSGMTVLGTNAKLWRLGANLFCRMVLNSETAPQLPTAQDESKANYNRSLPSPEAVKRFRQEGWKFL